MSNRICHACISFLNSWQSFKNRCYAAQKKQQHFLDVLAAKERAKQKAENQQKIAFERQRTSQQEKAITDPQRILKTALLNATSNSNSTIDPSIDIVCY